MRGAQLLDCLTAIEPANAEERAVARRVNVRVILASMVSVFVLISRKESRGCQSERVELGWFGWIGLERRQELQEDRERERPGKGLFPKEPAESERSTGRQGDSTNVLLPCLCLPLNIPPASSSTDS